MKIFFNMIDQSLTFYIKIFIIILVCVLCLFFLSFLLSKLSKTREESKFNRKQKKIKKNKRNLVELNRRSGLGGRLSSIIFEEGEEEIEENNNVDIRMTRRSSQDFKKKG